MPINCKDPNNCSSPYCQGYLPCYHQIDQPTYDAMVAAYFGPTPPAPVAVSASDLNLSLSCSGYYIDCAFDPANINENDITVSVKAGTGIAGRQFSLSLFNGMTAIFTPDTYYFSKAEKQGFGLCVIFYATVGGTTVYCGDLTEAYP